MSNSTSGRITGILLTLILFTVVNCNAQNSNFIAGKLTDDYKGVLFAAQIKIKHTGVSVVADNDGYYKIYLPDSLRDKKIVMVFSYVGLMTFETKVCTRKLPLTVNVELVGEYITEDITNIPRTVKSLKRSRRLN